MWLWWWRENEMWCWWWRETIEMLWWWWWRENIYINEKVEQEEGIKNKNKKLRRENNKILGEENKNEKKEG